MSEKVSPFEFVKSINQKKNHELIDVNVASYEPFVINRTYSYFADTVFFANEMNRFSGVEQIPKEGQFDFYYYGMPKKSNRFSKWIKHESFINKKNEEIFELLYSKYNREHNLSRKQVEKQVFPLFLAQLNQMDATGKKRAVDELRDQESYFLGGRSSSVNQE